MVKHAGHGHDPSGIDGTSRGGLLIPCCTCPYPSINLPDVGTTSYPKIGVYQILLTS